MKRRLLALGLVALLLPLAARASTWASTTPGETNVGDEEASASASLVEGVLQADAVVSGPLLAVRSRAELVALFFGQRGASSHAESTRTFRVIAPGPASISWFVDGALRAEAVDAAAVYQVNYSFHVEADAWFPVIASVGDLLSSDDPPGVVPIAESGTATHEFAEFQVGQVFHVTSVLDAIVSANNFAATGPSPSLLVESDFFDSAGISSISGGIREVPEPAGAELTLAAIAGIAALHAAPRCGRSS